MGFKILKNERNIVQKVKDKYPEYSAMDILDTIQKVFDEIEGNSESYKEVLTLDDVSQRKFKKDFKDLSDAEKKEVNYAYSEWIDESEYDEKCETKKEALQELKEKFIKKEAFEIGDKVKTVDGIGVVKSITHQKGETGEILIQFGKNHVKPFRVSTVTKESYKEGFKRFDDVRIKSKNLAGLIYEISGNDVVVKTKKGLIKSNVNDLEKMPNVESYKERLNNLNKKEYSFNDLDNDFKKFDWTAMMSDDFRVNARAGDEAHRISNEIKKLKQVDSKKTQDVINKYKRTTDFFDEWFKESYKERLNSLNRKEIAVQLSGAYDIPKLKSRIGKLCNNFGLTLQGNGKINFNDNKSLLKREINEFLGELKNIGVNYKLTESCINFKEQEQIKLYKHRKFIVDTSDYKRMGPNAILYKGDYYRPNLEQDSKGQNRTLTKDYFFTRKA